MRAAIGRGALALAALMWAAPAQAGEWQYDPGSDLIFHGSVSVGRWYTERPSMQEPAVPAPDYLVRCPHERCGYPLPIYKAPRLHKPVRMYRARGQAGSCLARTHDVRADRVRVRQQVWVRCRAG